MQEMQGVYARKKGLHLVLANRLAASSFDWITKCLSVLVPLVL